MISFNMRIKYVHEKMSLLGVGKRRKATDELQIGGRNVEGELEMKVFKKSNRDFQERFDKQHCM